MHQLLAYSWPGNVRELGNVADRFVLGLQGDALNLVRPVNVKMSLAEQIEHFERVLIEDQLRKYVGQVAAVCEALNVPKQTLYDKMRRFNLSAEQFRSDTAVSSP
jgi:two-component system C4-dicarboxylate transport response regulator DctD